MNIGTLAPRCPGKRIRTHASILLKAFCGALVLLVAIPVNAAETGIRGTVLWGPVKPGPTSPGQSDEEPFAATFHVLDSQSEVACFKSGANGTFEILLPAGDYTIVPDNSTPVPAPQSQAKTVTVPEDGFVVVTLRFDTGMR